METLRSDAPTARWRRRGIRHVVEPLHIGRLARIDHQDRAFRIGQGAEIETIEQGIAIGVRVTAGAGMDVGIDHRAAPEHLGRERADVIEQHIERGVGQPKHPQQRLDQRLLQLVEREIAARGGITILVHGLLRCCRISRHRHLTCFSQRSRAAFAARLRGACALAETDRLAPGATSSAASETFADRICLLEGCRPHQTGCRTIFRGLVYWRCRFANNLRQIVLKLYLRRVAAPASLFKRATTNRIAFSAASPARIKSK